MEKIILIDALARNLSIFKHKSAGELNALSATTLTRAAANGAYEADLENAINNYLAVIRLILQENKFKDDSSKKTAERYARILQAWVDNDSLKLSREDASVLIVNFLRY